MTSTYLRTSRMRVICYITGVEKVSYGSLVGLNKYIIEAECCGIQDKRQFHKTNYPCMALTCLHYVSSPACTFHPVLSMARTSVAAAPTT